MAKEKWSKGKHAGCVVSDTPNRHTRDDHVDYYGGHLIAESIPKQEYVNLIACAPSMLALLEKALPIIEEEAERRDFVKPSPEYLANASDNERQYLNEMRELADAISAEIDKAYGREGKSDG